MGLTYFKNPDNPSCIDLFLTNRQQYFQQTCAIETGISDFHKMAVTVMNTHYIKRRQKPFNTEIINVFINNLLFWN